MACVRVSGGGLWGDTAVTLIHRPRRRKGDKEFGLDSSGLGLSDRGDQRPLKTKPGA